MPGFIRVRAAKGPKHEFHAAVGEVAAHPELYRVIDSRPVSKPEPPKYFFPAPKPAKRPKPVGDPNKENTNAT